jgi:Zn-finger nucleic acid-binding protein
VVHDPGVDPFVKREPAYRGGILRCPGCAEPMRREPVPSAEIDVCEACGGLWVDWFDGDVRALATEAEAARQGRGPGRASSPGAGAPAGACPRCRQALRPELHRFSDARPGELVDGVELFRCPECAGSFVPRPSAHLLLDRVREPPAVTLREALVLLLKRLVGGRRP